MAYAAYVRLFGKPILSDKTRSLFFDRKNREVFVFVESESGGSYIVNPPLFLAIDCYRNPKLYKDAALQGITNPRRLNPVNMGGNSLLMSLERDAA